MAFEFKFPDVGEGIHEGEIVKWRVKISDEIKEDQPLVEMETAKAIVELPSPKSGTVLALVGKEGEVVHVGAILVVIGEKGEKWEPNVIARSVATKQSHPATAKSSPGVIGQIPTEEKGVTLPPRRPESNVIARPEWPKQSPLDFPGPVERIPLKSVRKAIAENMVKSVSTIPHVTHFDEVDASALIKLRADKKAEAEQLNIKLTYLAFIVQAVVETLKKHPLLNAFFSDASAYQAGAGAKEIIIKKYYNIGIAVDTEEGLMVPVIKDADKKDVFAIAKEIADLAEKARGRKLSIEDLQGASFSITNVGSIGGNAATPIIAYGQSANLAVMKMKDRPVAVDGKIEIRPILPLCLAFDHRVLDGADAARFMNDLIRLLEEIP